MNLAGDVARRYGLGDVELVDLKTAVNDVFRVDSPSGRFALKLYHRRRTVDAVQWEVDLVARLVERCAPVAPFVPALDGSVVQHLDDRIGVLSAWAPGAKPTPSTETYVLLGETAARIHAAADGFDAMDGRRFGMQTLVDEQLRLMRGHLDAIGRWPVVVAMGERLAARIADPQLDRGICHIDLTLDNVHRDGDTMTAFDFDSAGESCRAFEPYGVLLFARAHFADWLRGYRAVRPFSARDEQAVEAFAVIGDLRVVAWKLGVAESSRGAPQLSTTDLEPIVDSWLRWEAG